MNAETGADKLLLTYRGTVYPQHLDRAARRPVAFPEAIAARAPRALVVDHAEA